MRIFTVQEELPFAGHPTLGTAFALRGDSGAKEIVLELNVGKVPVRFEDIAGANAFGEMTQVDPVFGMQHEPESVARATGLSVEDFDAALPIETVSTGLAYTVVPLKSLAVIQNLRVDLNRASEYLEKTGGKFFYFVARATVDPRARLHARMLFYNGEDPATGSAAGCAAAYKWWRMALWLRRTSACWSGTRRNKIWQLRQSFVRAELRNKSGGKPGS